MSTDPKLYTLEAAGELLGVSVSTIRRLVASGALSSVSIGTTLDDPQRGHRMRIPAEAIEEFIKARTNVA